jgi:flavin reductase
MQTRPAVVPAIPTPAPANADAPGCVVDQQAFRTAMSRVGAAVQLITTDGPAGRNGMTATAMCAVSDRPAMLLVCLNRSGRALEMIQRNRSFCVNTLCGDDSGLADIFAGRQNLFLEERFGSGAWSTLATGSPWLTGAVAGFDCRVAATQDMGSHTVVFGEVLAVATGQHRHGLLYAGRSYRQIELGE